jgi:hypothetical protein
MRPLAAQPLHTSLQTITTPEPGAPSPAPLTDRRLGAKAHLAVPGALTALFCFRAGGFFPFWVSVAAVAVCLLLVLRITVASRPFAGWTPATAVAALAGAGLASWTLASALWSGAPERALVEFDRALLYFALLVLMAMAPRRRGDLAVVLRWVLLALMAAAVAGLASRLAPDVFPISGRFAAERLAFPLTYWNALGMASALACVLALHAASGAQEPPWVRVLGTAALPVAATALYFTFSRGAIAVCLLAIAVYVVLGASRRLLFTAAAAAAPLLIAVAAAWNAGRLATVYYFSGGGPAQGHRVALILVACTLVAAGLRVALMRLEARTLARPWRAPLSRRALAGAGVAAVVVAAAVAVAAGLPGKVADEAHSFGTGSFVPQTGDARDRLGSVHSSGRPQVWSAALDAFASEPLHGTGAGTFKLSWQARRPTPQEITDAHSLYFETLSELGVVGALLLAVVLLTPLAVAARRLTGPERHAHAAFVAAGVALLVHASVDWDWEMPALFVWYFGAAGAVLARDVVRVGDAGALARLPRVMAGLACLLLALTPALVLVSESRLHRAVVAFRAGDCTRAVDAALSVGDVLPRAGAYEIIGYCDLRARQDALGLKAMQRAHARDPENWQYLYGIAVAQAIGGKDPRATAAEALRRNPHQALARSLARALDTPSAARRFRAAAHAGIPTG